MTGEHDRLAKMMSAIDPAVTDINAPLGGHEQALLERVMSTGPELSVSPQQAPNRRRRARASLALVGSLLVSVVVATGALVIVRMLRR